MAASRSPEDERLAAFRASQVFDRLYEEGMALVEEAATYLDGPGRTRSKSLSRDAALHYAASSMDLSTRLMQAASWLVMQKAVHDGDMQVEEARQPRYRLARGVPLAPDPQLDPDFHSLVSRSERLFERVCRMDATIYGENTAPPDNPVTQQIEALRRAAQSGAFDPLAVWKQR